MPNEFEPPRPGGKLQTFGPTILGGLIVLAIVAGGWWFFQTRRETPPKQEIAQKTQTPPPSPTPAALESPKSVTQLPATGFPTLALGAASLAALAVGIALKKFYK